MCSIKNHLQKKYTLEYRTKLMQTMTCFCLLLALLAELWGVLWFDADPAQAEPGGSIVLQWEKLMGAKEDDRGICAQLTIDGNYIIAGETQSYYRRGHGGIDIYLAKLDTAGRLLWQNTIGDSRDNHILAISQTRDGGFIITGTTEASFRRDDQDIYLAKTNAAGNMQWQKNLGDTGDDTGTSVQQTSDGGYIITGTTTNISGTGDADVYLIKTNVSGQSGKKPLAVKKPMPGYVYSKPLTEVILSAGKHFARVPAVTTFF